MAATPITNGLGEAGAYERKDWPRYVRTTDIADSRNLKQDTFKSLPPALASRAMIQPGDLLMTAAGATIGKSYLHSGNEPACYAGYLVRFRSAPGVDPRFIAYWTESKPYWDQITTGAVRSTIDNFSAGKYRNMTLSAPLLEEQHRIADFLDAETARIDKLVRLRSRQSSLIGEGLAAEAVDLTGRSQIRGGGGRTESMVQLRRAAMSTQTGSTPANLHDLSDGSTSEDSIPWYTPAAIDSRMSITTAEKATHRNGVPLFPADSVLITGIGESLGKVAYLDHVATGNQQLTAITPQVGVSGRFMAWQLWAAEQEIREWAQYSRIRIINNDSLKSFPIYLPSRAEQDTVVRTLDSHMARVRQATDAFLRFQRLADERRRALITAAVTGQFDVSTASGRNVTDGVSA
ncbi:restriction endonuclease subunit S [Streptomyces pseudovenezuelae]|uniref:restriction endonuclease subunit S n=1 Tax=Streptomyces pseudovenezuelae TaxID=67350 RepID=UPI0036E49FD7